MRHLTRSIGCAALLLCFGSAIAVCQVWSTGDVFVAIGNGQYNVYDNNGVFLETLNDGSGINNFTTGCAFDANGNLFTTNFSQTKVYKFTPNSPTPSATIDTSLQGAVSTESVFIDSSGNLYAGNADGNHAVLKYGSSGNFLGSFFPATENRGTDWIDMASDQKTLFYTSEGTHVKRFDVSTSSPLADFASGLLGTDAYALRLLPPFDGSGGLLVADSDAIRRLDGSGNVSRTYTVANETSWFGLALDPNGTSFWAQDSGSEHLYRFNIATGAVEVGPIVTGGQQLGGGVCVKGQGSATLVTSYTTAPQTTTAGGSNTFTDPGGSGTNQTYQFPTSTQFLQDDNVTACSSPTAAIQFQYWDPALFNKSRLPAVPQNPDWCSFPGNQGLTCSPVPAGSACAPISVTGKGNFCIVEEAKCSCGGTQLAQCNVVGVSGPILVSNANNNYASPLPQNPGLVIGDDSQNDWEIMPQSPDGATCISPCTTQKLNTDITIMDVNQPDFSLTATPLSPLSPSVGVSATSTISVTGVYGFNQPVTLSVLNPPAGVITSISPSSITAQASPLTSTLTVTPLTTGSYTLDVEGNNGTPPTNLTHFAFVTVNVAANISTSGITNVITTLLNNNCIDNSGIANALTSKLSAAQGFINVSNNKDAINTLTALNNQINAQSGKHIYTTCTISGSTFNPVSILTSDVQTLINSLRVGLLGDPITGYALNSSGVAIQGATVSILSGANTIASATTDVTGFYYFATTNLLTSGSTYSIKVTGLAGYSTATPTSSTFTWYGTLQNFNFTLN